MYAGKWLQAEIHAPSFTHAAQFARFEDVKQHCTTDLTALICHCVSNNEDTNLVSYSGFKNDTVNKWHIISIEAIHQLRN
jgi:hypothetical protein